MAANRDQLDIDKVSTGEHWLAKDAFDLKLIDRLCTSDDYLLEKSHPIKHLNLPFP